MAEYATITDLKATLSLTGETFADPDLAVAILAASRAIDSITHRRFYADADADQVRFYTPPSAGMVTIDDLITLTAFATDTDGDGTFETTWTVNTDIVLEPLNAAADREPYTHVRMHPNTSNRLPSADYPRSVRITGKFGWVAVPDAIKQATALLACRLMRRTREAPFGVIAAGIDASAAMQIARVDPDIRLLTQPYVRRVLLI